MQAELSALGVRVGPNANYRVPPAAPVGNAVEAPLSRLLGVLDSFPTSVGYLQGRRKVPFLGLDDEAAVQDLLFLSVKPVLPELVYEEPTRKGAAGYAVGDFSVPSMKLILGVKFVKTPADVRAKANEIAQDVTQYSAQTDCQMIIFFVYDPLMLIPDRPNFVAKSSGTMAWDGREIALRTMIKPD